MKILAFAASNSKNSINKQIVTHATNVFKSEFDQTAEIEVLDSNDYEMPIYSIDREKDGGIPAKAQEFYDKIGESDAIIISFAEYNGNFTSAYKNIFDWASRIKMKVYQGKPVLHISGSIGPNGGANVLKIANDSAPHFAADLKASFSVGSFGEKFDANKGEFKDADLAAKLRNGLKAIA